MLSVRWMLKPDAAENGRKEVKMTNADDNVRNAAPAAHAHPLPASAACGCTTCAPTAAPAAAGWRIARHGGGWIAERMEHDLGGAQGYFGNAGWFLSNGADVPARDPFGWRPHAGGFATKRDAEAWAAACDEASAAPCAAPEAWAAVRAAFETFKTSTAADRYSIFDEAVCSFRAARAEARIGAAADDIAAAARLSAALDKEEAAEREVQRIRDLLAEAEAQAAEARAAVLEAQRADDRARAAW